MDKRLVILLFAFVAYASAKSIKSHSPLEGIEIEKRSPNPQCPVGCCTDGSCPGGD